MHPKSKEFKELQAKWYKKLEKSGFKEAEQEDGRLKNWHSWDFPRKYGANCDRSAEEYYNLAGKFLYEHKFDLEIDRKIWELHAQGLGIREIVKVLKSKKAKSIWKVHMVLKKLQAILALQWKKP